LNEPLSILELVLNASIVVQIVMATLILASLVSWVMIFQRGFSLSTIRREATEFENEFWSGQDLRKIYIALQERGEDPIGVESIFAAGFREFTRSRQQQEVDPDRVMQNVQRAMRVAMSREEERLETHLPFLATVGSTSPYIGLFGTVWGIMNSFRALAGLQTATLANVAPGIAEALIATAMGLFAAIPAVVAYNRFSNDVERLTNRYHTFMEELSTLLQRHASH